MHCVYRNDLCELARLAADIEAFASQNGLGPDTAHVFNLCLDELLTNIVSYGFHDKHPHEIHLELTAAPNEIIASIRDDGAPFDPLTQAPVPDLNIDIEDRKIGGLGVHFVKTLMTRVSYRREGNWNILEMARTRNK